MSIADKIAAGVRQVASRPDRDGIRVRMLGNLAAALGVQSESDPILRAMEGDTGPAARAFSLATRMHARTQDDFHPEGRIHAGAVVIPAVLAGGAEDLIGAVAAGYQAATLVAEVYAPDAQRRGFRPTGIFGPIGAAAAAGVAAGANDKELAQAIAMAAATSAGHNQAWVDGGDEWLFEVAAASRSGLDAARIALSGAQAATGAFEGKAGWCGAYFGDPGGTALEPALANPSDRTAGSAMKLYPVSGIAQTPTHLAAQLGKELGGDDIRRVEVRMSRNEVSYPGTGNRGPFRSRSDSLMSVPRCVVIALLRGSTPYAVLRAPADADQERLMDRVELAPQEDFEDGTVEIVIETESGDEHRRFAHAADFLFPRWSEVTADLAGLAARTESPPGAVERLADVLSDDPTAEEISAIVDRAR